MKKHELKLLAKQFASVTVKHDKQNAAKEQIEFIVSCDDISIIVLTGPTGSGKSTLLEQFASEYLAERAAEMQADPSLRPIAYATATASGHKGFDWKTLYATTRRNHRDPFAATRSRRNDGRKPSIVLIGEDASAALQREQLESSFIATGTTIWIIDEAQHVLNGGKSGTPGHQYDILKSLAQSAGVQLILCGPFDLPTSMAHSGQLSRRTARVSLNRYRWAAAEIKVFASAIDTLLKNLPVELAYPDVKSNLEFFYIRTLGCVGIFKDWAAKTFLRVIKLGRTEMTLTDFEKTSLTPKQLATINNEIVDGESEYGDIVAGPDAELVRAILAGAMANGAPEKTSGAGGAHAPSKPKAKAGIAFERKPTRDKVGEEV
jgi:energy-coupling factor transporter ATP-binding protein EcfA2